MRRVDLFVAAIILMTASLAPAAEATSAPATLPAESGPKIPDSVLKEMLEMFAVRPSGEKAVLVIPLECPSSVRISRPWVASHSFSVPSEPPESAMGPSGEIATLDTGAGLPEKVSSGRGLR